jgi:hypothetical protein
MPRRICSPTAATVIAAAVIAAADAKIGAAIMRILAEGVPKSLVAELTELSVKQVQKLKAATVEATVTPAESGKAGRPGSAGSAKSVLTGGGG